MPLELNRQSSLEKRSKEKPHDTKEVQEVETKFTAVLLELQTSEKADSPLFKIIADILDEPDQNFVQQGSLKSLDKILKTATKEQKDKILWLYGYMTEIDELNTKYTTEIKEAIKTTRDLIKKTTSEISKVLKSTATVQEQKLIDDVAKKFELAPKVVIPEITNVVADDPLTNSMNILK